MQKKWGSFWGWGSFQGWDHFGVCTDPLTSSCFLISMSSVFNSLCFLLQASNSTFCTFPAFLCWNHSIAFLHPFLSFFHGFHFLELHFFSCSFLFLMALLFVASWRLLQESIYLLYFWTNTTCSFFLFVFCFEFGHQDIEPFSQGALVNIGFEIEGVIESCGNLIPQFSSLSVPLSGLRKIWSPYLSQK